MSVRTVIQRGPKGKKTAAFAIDWPGWSRGAKTPEVAVETLEAYRERYRPVARLAALEREFDAAGALDVIEDSVGTGSTDFWGISFAASSFEEGPMPLDELERKIALLEAAWQFFDDVVARVSPTMRKGSRGGGRDRDEVVGHTFRTEAGDFAKQIGVASSVERMLTPDGSREHRAQFVAAVRQYNAENRKAGRTSTLPFLVRHTAFHVLDHAWEMEDKDLS
ncbi:MAG: hypothetical protein ABI305_11875 [Tepidiformaceae bacterium]